MMTREKAKTTPKSTEPNSGSEPYNKGLKKANTIWKHRVNAIYDSFENRTCENCNWYSYTEGKQPDGMLWINETCGVYSDVVPELIEREGCNQWSKKDV